MYDVGTYDGTPYVVSELLEGETLGSKMAGSALPLRKCLDYGIQMARGLAAAHAKGIVHRDLKPDNLFVTNDGRLKILDFGLAKLARSEPLPYLSQETTVSAPPRTAPGTVLGTVGYMAPEQVRGLPADHRADIFAVGAIFYEMLLGRRAYKGDTAAETMYAILKLDPLELPGAERVLPPDVEPILRHCLEKSPDERFQSARDLAFHLEAGQKRQLSDPQPPALGDAHPAISPDGHWLVFRRNIGGVFNGELYRLALGRGLTAGGEPRRLTLAALNADYPAWMPDSREILFSARGSLWRLAVTGENTPDRLPFVGENGLMPVVSRAQPGGSHRLVYVRSFDDYGIWRVLTSAPGALASSPPAVSISSTKYDGMPDFSPEGRRVAFSSDRSGDFEIWVAVPCRPALG